MLHTRILKVLEVLQFLILLGIRFIKFFFHYLRAHYFWCCNHDLLLKFNVNPFSHSGQFNKHKTAIV